jgi:hypothetical protein
MGLQVLIWDLMGQQLPQHHSVGPHINALRAWLMADHLRSHPGDSACEAHDGAHVIPLATSSEVAYLDH